MRIAGNPIWSRSPKETLALWQSTGKAESSRAAPGEAGEKPYSIWWYVLVALLMRR